MGIRMSSGISIWSSDLSHENYDITIGDDFVDPNSDSPIVNLPEFNGSLAVLTTNRICLNVTRRVYTQQLWGFHGYK